MQSATIDVPAIAADIIDITTANARSRANASEPAIKQEFRLLSIESKTGDIFKIKYQVADGEEWMPERNYELPCYLAPSPKYYEQLLPIIGRVFSAEWGSKEVRIKTLKFHYADVDDKGDLTRGVQPRKPGELIKLTIGSEYQSGMIISKKAEPWLTLGAFDQYVCKDMDDSGYLQREELESLQDLLNEFGVSLAKKLNERVEFKAKQLRLF